MTRWILEGSDCSSEQSHHCVRLALVHLRITQRSFIPERVCHQLHPDLRVTSVGEQADPSLDFAKSGKDGQVKFAEQKLPTRRLLNARVKIDFEALPGPDTGKRALLL